MDCLNKKLALWQSSIFIYPVVGAQYTTDKVARLKNEAVNDSMKTVEYLYWLPFRDEKVVQKGLKLQKPDGLNVRYLWQQFGFKISNFRIGFNKCHFNF